MFICFSAVPTKLIIPERAATNKANDPLMYVQTSELSLLLENMEDAVTLPMITTGIPNLLCQFA